MPRRRTDVRRCLYPLYSERPSLECFDHRSWHFDDVFRGYSGIVWRIWQLLYAFANRRTGYGVSAHEQPVFLALCGGYDAGNLLSSGARRKRSARFWRGLGSVSTALGERRRHVDGSGDLRGACVGRLLHPGCDQYDHHILEHARPRNVAFQSAAVFMVNLRDKLADIAVASGSCWRDHHVVDGS